MVLKSLELRNFRRFRTLLLEFPENLQGLIGANGAGKSTIIEAIAWALYGNRAARGTKLDIRTQDLPPREMCSVNLIFELGGLHYRVERQLRGKNAVAEAAIYNQGGGDPLAESESGVNDYVAKIVGLDYRSFFASIFARQKDLAALGDMRPEERKVAINRLINIDAIDRARKEAQRLRTDKENQLRGMQSVVKDTGELEQRIREYKEQVRHEEAAVQLARDAVQAALDALNESKAAYEAQNALRDKHLQLQAELGKCSSELGAVERQFQDAQEEVKRIESSESQLQALEPQRRRFLEIRAEKEHQEKLRLQVERAQKLTAQIADEQEQIDAEQKIILRLQSDISHGPDPDSAFDALNTRQETLRQEEQKLRTAHHDIVAKAGEIASKGKDARDRREKLGTLGAESPCPVCTRPLAEHYDDVLRLLDDEIERLRDVYRQVKQERGQVEEKLELNKIHQQELQKEREKQMEKITLVRRKRQELQEAQRRQGQFLNRARQLKDELDAIGDVRFDEKEYNTILAEFEKLNKVYEHALKLEAQVERKSELQQRLAQVQQRQSALVALQASLQQQLEEQAYDAGAFAAARDKYDADREQVDTVRETLLEAEKALITKRSQLQNAEQELSRIRAQLKKIAQLEEERQYYEALAFHFGRFRLELAGRLRPLIAARASELLRLTTGGRYSLLELDDDYNIFIIDQGTPHPLLRFSGGEQDLANLCLRVAISQVVAERGGKAPVQFIVLDEVFGSQDSQRQNLIMQALQHLQSQFRQIFLISHVESIKDILPVIVQVEMTSSYESKAWIL